ncbi:MAG: 30S ribosomal protein S1 [Myxococcaceae bacterium]|nr:30S ribosomal protein S1 [Myxococcaceae bacterium]MBH2005903.1 30S ribosomal protein S1 [Myxococcaceae bacterium]
MRTQEETLSFEDLLNESYARDEVLEGEIVSATVLSVGRDFVSVDIGYKSEGLIAASEFPSVNGEIQIQVGDKVDVMVESREDESGHLILSKDKADRVKVWDEISLACERDEIVEGTVTGRVKGGLQVDIGVRAFLPGSQVDLRPIRNLDKMIGERFQFKVIKFNKKRGNIVLSRRSLLEREREEKRGSTLQFLAEGAILDGTIKNMTDYGAFVDLGGVDGLLHVTDMSWGRIQNPSELFQVGSPVRVKVLKYDPEHERVSLGMKQIQEDPWLGAPQEFLVGTQVKGKVVSLTDYGAFVELKPGIEGLIHVSEMSWTKRVKHPSKVLNIGDEVNAMVLDIDQTNKRISLGIKQIEPNPWTLLENKYPVGTVIRGQIRNLTDFGIFIGIEDGIDGLVHISDLSWTHRVKHPSEVFQKGDEVEAVVLNIDVDNERFSLGIKQLHEDPWGRIPHVYPRGARVKGLVSKVTDFGAFIEIEPGIDGLCHVSEFSDEHIQNPHEFVKPGDEVEVMIIDIDSEDRKIGLSMKAIRKAEKGFDYRSYLSQQNSSVAKISKGGMGTLGDALKGFNVSGE